MKRLLAILLFAFTFSASAQNSGTGIKKLQIDDNFFVLTDTVTSTIEFRYPKSGLNYFIKSDGNTVVFEKIFNEKRLGYIGYSLDSLVDNTGSTFANIDSLESWLRLNTGFNPAGSAATPTLAEVLAEGSTATSDMAITGDVDITGSLDVDNVNINGSNIQSTSGALMFKNPSGTTTAAVGVDGGFYIQSSLQHNAAAGVVPIGTSSQYFGDAFVNNVEINGTSIFGKNLFGGLYRIDHNTSGLYPAANSFLNLGLSTHRWLDFHLGGAIKTVTSSTPSNPSTSSEANIYVKGGKLVIQYNDAGTVRYKYLDLTSTGVTWTHTTTAP